jgi:hypothetical protein
MVSRRPKDLADIGDLRQVTTEDQRKRLRELMAWFAERGLLDADRVAGVRRVAMGSPPGVKAGR